MMNKKRNAPGCGVYVLFAAAVILIMLICCSVGRYHVSPGDVFRSLAKYLFGANYDIEQNAYNAVIFMRLPRVVMSVLVGISLSISGCVYQSIFNNKLVSPDLLGVTDGSCVGAALAILLGGSGFAITVNSFIFGIFAVILALLLTSMMRSGANITLVLSGIIVSAVFTSVLGLIKYTADSLEKLETITFWIMGSFSSVTMQKIQNTAPFIILATGVLVLLRYRINIISLGKMEAEMLGVRFKLTRIVVIACATVLTACSTAVCGTVSWIGLIIPHVARLFAGSNNQNLIPFSAFLGAAALPVIDTLCRSLTVNEIPISILSAAIGAVVYCVILVRKGKGLHD